MILRKKIKPIIIKYNSNDFIAVFLLKRMYFYKKYVTIKMV